MTRLAQCHLALGDIDGARGVLSEVLALHPGLAMAHALMARVHVAEGRADRAIEALDNAIRHDAQAWGGLVGEARLVEGAGRMRQAAVGWRPGLQV